MKRSLLRGDLDDAFGDPLGLPVAPRYSASVEQRLFRNGPGLCPVFNILIDEFDFLLI